MWIFLQSEIKHWCRRPMLWIFLGITTLLVIGAQSSDFISIGGVAELVNRNAPSVIMNLYGIMSTLVILMVTAIIHNTASRDYDTRMSDLIFTSPIQKYGYFFGKFIGVFMVSLIPVMGISIGMLIAPFMPWAPVEQYGPLYGWVHMYAFLTLGMTNVFIFSVIIYALSMRYRSALVSYAGAFALLITNTIASMVGTSKIEWQKWGTLIDPFGIAAVDYASKYLSIAQLNTTVVSFTGVFLGNRIIWLGVALVVLGVLYRQFSFSELRSKRTKHEMTKPETTRKTCKALSSYTPSNPNAWRMFFSLTAFYMQGIFKNIVFKSIALFMIIGVSMSFLLSQEPYGTQSVYTTYFIVDIIEGNTLIFYIALIIFFAGMLVWKERDARIHEIVDAMPRGGNVRLFAQASALMGGLAILQLGMMAVGVFAQLASGYTNIEWTTYVGQLFGFRMLWMLSWIALALAIQTIVNQRYIGYFLTLVFFIANGFLPAILQTDYHFFQYASGPVVILSEMNGYGPYLASAIWHQAYWVLWSVAILLATVLFTICGERTRWRERWREMKARLRCSVKEITAVGISILLVGGWIVYNTTVLNNYDSARATEQRQKEYELKYRSYANMPQPRWIKMDFDVEIYPESRSTTITVDGTLKNKTATPIKEVHFTLPALPKRGSVEITISGATLTMEEERVYRIYTLAQPLQPGQTIAVNITSSVNTQGFEHEVSFPQLTDNGTFFVLQDFLPALGYESLYEVRDPSRRKSLGLSPLQRMDALDENDMKARNKVLFSDDADWITMRTVVGTSADQIAVAPGHLVTQWNEKGRRYFEYAVEQKAMAFSAVASARFVVQREKFKGIDLEVYHIPQHRMNVPRMIQSMRDALDYYTTNFGPYPQKVARIIEFPRYAEFAQSFVGTMPYSEGLGFTYNYQNLKSDDIDLVYYVVAHEMAHQYWGHQLVAPAMQGSQMIMESFTQYSALMVMEKRYGKDAMRKFLRYELERYLTARSTEQEEELPLWMVENQPYLYYNKGSLVMYYLKEMIGSENVNRALRQLLETYRFAEPPYPTSSHAVRAFRQVTPSALQYVIDDLFTRITLYSNAVVEAVAKRVGDEYEVTFKTKSTKMSADGTGKETAMPITDFVDIAIFAKPVPNDPTYSSLGKPLLYERVKLSQADNTFVRRVQELPDQVGIDPYQHLITKDMSSNVRTVKIQP